MRQWEYDIEFIGASFRRGLQEVLEERGEEGWEAWHLVPDYDRNYGAYSYTIYFKRKTELNAPAEKDLKDG